jgi:L-lactate dehydrogenase complex protein LldE
MVRVHFERLFEDDPAWRTRARELAGRTYELTQFLVDVMEAPDIGHPPTAPAVYHDSCSGLRELGIKAQPRRLLGAVQDYSGSETCCGFGGTFCVKYPEISDRIVGQRTGEIGQTKAELLIGGDLGCLLNLAGKLSREGSEVRVFHVAEVLAGLVGPAIGEPP